MSGPLFCTDDAEYAPRHGLIKERGYQSITHSLQPHTHKQVAVEMEYRRHEVPHSFTYVSEESDARYVPVFRENLKLTL